MPFWGSPAILSGRVTVAITLGSVQDYNLWTNVGSPTSPADIFVTVQDGAYLDTFIVGNFHSSSILTIVPDPLGTGVFYIRGRGGVGGAGGSGEASGDVGDFLGFPAAPGLAAGHAFANTPGIEVRINLDDGYCFGGGGGGGGGGVGGSYPTPTGVTGGGGGGGGQGWNTSGGGAGGLATPFDTSAYPDGSPGASGGAGGPGTGGAGGVDGSYNGGTGGAGGVWGAAGTVGGAATHVETRSPGAGGAAGKAFSMNGGTLVYTGAKNEATLISENRIKGATS